MKSIPAIILIAVLTLTSACASAKKVKPNKGETEIQQLCEYVTDQTNYYGNGVGESTDMQMAKDKATAAARAQIAEALKVSVERFAKQYRSDLNGIADTKFEDSLQTITIQTLSGSTEVCSRIVRTDTGRYRAYVSVALPKEEVVNAIRETVKSSGETQSIDQRQAEFEKSINGNIINSNQ